MTPKVTVTIDRAAINRRTQKGLQSAAIDLGKALDKAISSAIWDYPFAPSPRDIVRTGDLLRSRKTVFAGTGVRFLWEVDYAIYVHEGVVLKNGTRLPPRRWTVKAESLANLPNAFKKGF